jgi:hypothetical protein
MDGSLSCWSFIAFLWESLRGAPMAAAAEITRFWPFLAVSAYVPAYGLQDLRALRLVSPWTGSSLGNQIHCSSVPVTFSLCCATRPDPAQAKPPLLRPAQPSHALMYRFAAPRSSAARTRRPPLQLTLPR